MSSKKRKCTPAPEAACKIRTEARFRRQCEEMQPPNTRRYVFYDMDGNDVRDNYVRMVVSRAEASFASVFGKTAQLSYSEAEPVEFRQLPPENALVVSWMIGKMISNYNDEAHYAAMDYRLLQRVRAQQREIAQEPASPEGTTQYKELRRILEEAMGELKRRVMKCTRILKYVPPMHMLMHPKNWPRLKSTRSGSLRAHQISERAEILEAENVTRYSYPVHTISFVAAPTSKYMPVYVELEVVEVQSHSLGKEPVEVYVPVNLYAGIYPKDSNEGGAGVFVDAEDIYTTNIEYEELGSQPRGSIDLTSQIYGGPYGDIYKAQAPFPVQPIFARPDAPAFIDTMLAAVARYAIPERSEQISQLAWMPSSMRRRVTNK